MGFVFQPFAEQRAEERAIPLVTFDGDGPPRCPECRAYVNPWFIWTSSGQKWKCNICGTTAQGGVVPFPRLMENLISV